MSFSNFKNEDNKVAMAMDLKNEKRNTIQERDKAEYEILKGNTIIREFMQEPQIPIRCKYHTSMDWLWPVVEIIMAGAHIQIEQNSCYLNSVLYRGKTTFDAIYKVVLEYINWYNQNKK